MHRTIDDSAPRLGDYVTTVPFGHRGRVTDIHWSCPEGRAWRRMQQGIRPEQFEGESWVSVLVHEGGSVVVPISHATVVAPFSFKNRFADRYFRD